jgi:hypothetical protein
MHETVGAVIQVTDTLDVENVFGVSYGWNHRKRCTLVALFVSEHKVLRIAVASGQKLSLVVFQTPKSRSELWLKQLRLEYALEVTGGEIVSGNSSSNVEIVGFGKAFFVFARNVFVLIFLPVARANSPHRVVAEGAQARSGASTAVPSKQVALFWAVHESLVHKDIVSLESSILGVEQP